MTLRRQLLIVSLLLLALPWAGCQFIRETESTLRQGQEQALEATANAIATVLAQQPALLYPYPDRRKANSNPRRALYAYPAKGPIIVDGYGDGWEEVPGQQFSAESDSVFVQAQTRDETLYLLFKVHDEQVVYHNPGFSRAANGDRLILRLWQDDRRQDYVIATAAPGSVEAQPENSRYRRSDPQRIRGYWQDSAEGFSLELEVPLAYTGGRLGFFVIDEDSANAKGAVSTGNTSRLDSSAPPWLIFHPAELKRFLAAFAEDGVRIQVVDREGFQLSDLAAAPSPGHSDDGTFWLLRLLYRTILFEEPTAALSRGSQTGKPLGNEISSALRSQSQTLRYSDGGNDRRTLLSTAVPIRDNNGVFGAVVIQQSAETYLSLTDKAFGRLLRYSMAALFVGVFGLLLFASVLSLRIRALSHAAGKAIAEDGRIVGQFTQSHANDEIGDLSRQYGQLLTRVQEYNDYLRTLSRKLAHELRTPIAVIQSSLDNLEQGKQPANETPYLPRAREGLQRLQTILTAMSEANRLEESIHQQDLDDVDLVPLLNDLFAAYRQIYTGHVLNLHLDTASAHTTGAPDLLVQAIDKLMENAATFTPVGDEITLLLERRSEHCVVAVENAGPQLARGAAERIFDPMVSLREGKADDVHLGLGLHIVRLIMEFHRGSAAAHNRDNGDGVRFELVLPARNNT